MHDWPWVHLRGNRAVCSTSNVIAAVVAYGWQGGIDMTWNRMRQLVAAMLVGLILVAATGYASAAVVEGAGGR